MRMAEPGIIILHNPAKKIGLQTRFGAKLAMRGKRFKFTTGR
jgi:hypothetical protein